MSLHRRRLLGLSGAAAASAFGLTGCSVGDRLGADGTSGRSEGRGEVASCVPRTSLSRQSGLGGVPLVYEIDRRRSSFWFDSGFHDQLTGWLGRFVGDARLDAEPEQVWTYGSWIDGEPDCGSWHDAGRAFDLSRLRRGGRDVVSCRYDQWQNASDAVDRRRRYWALAASLHHDFAYVLTYLYNDQHRNHIHVDNGRSGSGLSTLSTRSRVQVQAVQAMLSYLWDTPVELSGRWDADTRWACRVVLGRIGLDGDLTDSPTNWRGFLRAGTARFSTR